MVSWCEPQNIALNTVGHQWAKWTKCYLDWQLLHNLCYVQLSNLAKKIPAISSQQSDYQDLGGWVLTERQVQMSEIGIVSPN